MQTPTTPAQSAKIFFTESGTNYLQPIFIPLQPQQGNVQAEPSNTTRVSIGIADSVKSDQKLSFDAEWLSIVEQRILSSIPVEGYSMKGDAAWLQPQVGHAALDFFRRTSAALPSEPYIYSSQAGELVAEFAGVYGKMTCLISPDFVILFATTEDRIVEKKFLPNQQNDTLQTDIQAVTKMLNTGPNGTKMGS